MDLIERLKRGKDRRLKNKPTKQSVQSVRTLNEIRRGTSSNDQINRPDYQLHREKCNGWIGGRMVDRQGDGCMDVGKDRRV